MIRMTEAQVESHQAHIRGAARTDLRALPAPSVLPSRPTKYGAVRTQVDGIWFDSKLEAAHYRRLQLLAAAGLISDLRVHSRWPLVVNGVDCGAYEADFDHLENGIRVIVDVKGKATDLYRFKRKIFEACYSVKILEIRKPGRSR